MIRKFILNPLVSLVSAWGITTFVADMTSIDPSAIEKAGSMGIVGFVVYYCLAKLNTSQEKNGEHLVRLSGSVDKLGDASGDLLMAVKDLRQVVHDGKCKAGEK